MGSLWDLHQATSRQLHDHLPRPLALTTLLTYLSRLETKGYVRRSPGQRGFVYRPAVERASVASRLLDQVLDQFQGRLSSLVGHFVRTRRLSDDERQRLRRVLKDWEESDP
jgi:predicted transcriptional regulator